MKEKKFEELVEYMGKLEEALKFYAEMDGFDAGWDIGQKAREALGLTVQDSSPKLSINQ